jgi:hypothetical protein
MTLEEIHSIFLHWRQTAAKYNLRVSFKNTSLCTAKSLSITSFVHIFNCCYNFTNLKDKMKMFKWNQEKFWSSLHSWHLTSKNSLRVYFYKSSWHTITSMNVTFWVRPFDLKVLLLFNLKEKSSCPE